MIKKIFSVCGVLTAFLLVSCTERTATVEALPGVDARGQTCFVTSDGSMHEVSLAGIRVSQLVNGYFSASTPDGVTVYSFSNGKAEAVSGLSGLKTAGFMSCGVIPVCRPGGHIELVDGNGERVALLELENGDITECAPYFVDGVLVVTDRDGYQGLVDTKGKFIIVPTYESIGPIADGKMIAMSDKEHGSLLLQHYYVIDTDGKMVYDFEENVPVSLTLKNDKAVIRSEQGFAVLDVNNGVMTELPSFVRHIDSAARGYIVYRDAKGLRGLLDLDGNTILGASYRQLRIGPDGTVAANTGTKWMVIDIKTGLHRDMPDLMMLSPIEAAAYDKGFAFVGKSSAGYFIINRNGDRMNSEPLREVDYSRLSTAYVATDYPAFTAPEEMPGDYTGEFE